MAIKTWRQLPWKMTLLLLILGLSNLANYEKGGAGPEIDCCELFEALILFSPDPVFICPGETLDDVKAGLVSGSGTWSVKSAPKKLIDATNIDAGPSQETLITLQAKDPFPPLPSGSRDYKPTKVEIQVDPEDEEKQTVSSWLEIFAAVPEIGTTHKVRYNDLRTISIPLGAPLATHTIPLRVVKTNSNRAGTGTQRELPGPWIFSIKPTEVALFGIKTSPSSDPQMQIVKTDILRTRLGMTHPVVAVIGSDLTVTINQRPLAPCPTYVHCAFKWRYEMTAQGGTPSQTVKQERDIMVAYYGDPSGGIVAAVGARSERDEGQPFQESALLKDPHSPPDGIR